MSASQQATEPQSEIDDKQTSQQAKELRNGKKPCDWIEEEWDTLDKENSVSTDCNRLASVVSIFRVPNFVKEVNKKAYVPTEVSLGPYHHSSGPIYIHKKRALQRMRMRSRFGKDTFCCQAKNKISQLEDKIRYMYEEEIDYKQETLSKMLTLDGSFILEILRSLDECPQSTRYYEPIFRHSKIDLIGIDILNDILKLENQIPLVVLQNLLELELINSDDSVQKELLKILVINPSHKFYPFSLNKKEISQWSFPCEEVPHLLGLLHRLIVSPPHDAHEMDRVSIKCSDAGCKMLHCIECCRYRCIMYHKNEDEDKDKEKEEGKGKGKETNHIDFRIDCGSTGCMMLHKDRNKATDDIPHAVELTNAGIKFESRSGGIKRIKFDQNSATLYLPPIIVTDHTEVLFRNLIAYELCKPSEYNYVSCYLSLMDGLIDSKEDVALLRRKGIVTNMLGSDTEVADLFNGLCKGVAVYDTFDNLIQEVNAHYRNEFKVQCAEFVKEHLSSLWKALAWVAAIAIVLLTVVQTIFTILSTVN